MNEQLPGMEDPFAELNVLEDVKIFIREFLPPLLADCVGGCNR